MVLALCEGRSKRIGAAPDLGYWLRHGIDPVEAVRSSRTASSPSRCTTSTKPEERPRRALGQRNRKSREFFQELHRHNIKPTMIGLEYSHDWLESMPKLAKCIEFFNATTLELTNNKP
jgi:hypothetical protein